MLNNPLVL